MQRSEHTERTAQEAPKTLNRREFVRRLTAATAGGGLLTAAFSGCLLSSSQRAETAQAVGDQLGKLPRRPLGSRMDGMMIAPIMICQDSAGDLLGPSLAAGMNYIHKAGYWGRMPEELKKLPRESYYTDITVDSTPNDPDNEERAYRQVVDSLARNGLGYYDIFRAHYGWKTVAAMKEQRGTHRAFERLKREGKVKYFGVSQHDYVPYPEIIQAQIDEGLISSIQVFLSYGTRPESLAVFEKARRAGIGVIAMKTVAQGGGRMRGNAARQEELKAPGMVGRACLRHVLTLRGSDGKPYVDAAVSNLRNFEMFEENIGAVAAKAAAADGFVLV